MQSIDTCRRVGGKGHIYWLTYSADTIPLILVSFLSILFGPLSSTENLGNTVYNSIQIGNYGDHYVLTKLFNFKAA